jgi:hypothetical protein
MQCFEVQVIERPNFPQGYSRGMTEDEMNGSYNDWDIIMEEMQKRPHQKFISYRRVSTWTPDGGTYYYPGSSNTCSLNIPTGTHREFLRVYTEDK